eukprot:294373-Pyramimonas_sp.AAC.1
MPPGRFAQRCRGALGRAWARGRDAEGASGRSSEPPALCWIAGSSRRGQRGNPSATEQKSKKLAPRGP